MTKPSAAILLACFISLGSGCLAADTDLPGIQSLKNLEARDRATSIELASQGGNLIEQSLKTLRVRYPGYKIVSGCIASFKTDGAHDVAFALVNPNTKTGVYAVGMSMSKSDDVLEVAKFPIEFNSKGVIPKSLEVRCESRSALLRIVQEYSATRTETPAASAAIKPISYFDAVCIAPFSQPDDFICYDYSNASKAFVKIGSWFND